MTIETRAIAKAKSQKEIALILMLQVLMVVEVLCNVLA
jgi:hypothetical protein